MWKDKTEERGGYLSLSDELYEYASASDIVFYPNLQG